MFRINHSKLQLAIKLCWLLLFIVYIISVVTGNYLTIIVENEFLQKLDAVIMNTPIVFTLLNLIMYYLNAIIVYYAILQKPLFKYNIIALSSIILIFWSIKTIFIEYEFVNYIDFLTLGILILYIPKQWYRVVAGTLMSFIIVLLTSQIKNIVILDYENLMSVSPIATVLFSIDVYIADLLYYFYSLKGGEHHEPFIILWRTQVVKIKDYYHKCISSISSCWCRSSSNRISIDFTELWCNLIFGILTYSVLIVIGILYGRVLEILISAVTFHILRDKDSTTFHAENSFKCFLVSVFSFLIIAKLALPLHTSLFMSIMLAYALTTVMYFIRRFIDFEIRFKKRLESMTLEEMQEMFPHRCSYDIKCVYAYLNRGSLNADVVANKYNYSTRQIQRIIKEMKNDLQ